MYDGALQRSSVRKPEGGALALLEARHAVREHRGSVRLMLLACDGRGERFSQKIWDLGRGSLAERWHAGKAAGERVLARVAELDVLAAGSLEIHRLVVPNAGIT